MKQPLIGVLDDWGSVGRRLQAAGAVVMDIDTKDELKRAAMHCDAIVLTGGGDVDPARYGADEHPQTYGVDHSRDMLEFKAVRLARKRSIPLLGICRGHQLINVAHGGTLHQHLGDYESVHKHDGSEHLVLFADTADVSTLLPKDRFPVTSLHHQAVDRVGDGLLPIAWAYDGTVEALESLPGANHYVLGVQFHPEMAGWDDEAAQAIFDHFVQVCQERSRHTSPAEKRAEKVDKYWRGAKTRYWGGHTGWDDDGAWHTPSHGGPVSTTPKGGSSGSIVTPPTSSIATVGDYVSSAKSGPLELVPRDAYGRLLEDMSRMYDDDYCEWEKMNSIANEMQVAEEPDEWEGMACVEPPCMVDGKCSMGECLREELAYEFQKEVDARKRGNGRG